MLCQNGRRNYRKTYVTALDDLIHRILKSINTGNEYNRIIFIAWVGLFDLSVHISWQAYCPIKLISQLGLYHFPPSAITLAIFLASGIFSISTLYGSSWISNGTIINNCLLIIPSSFLHHYSNILSITLTHKIAIDTKYDRNT